MLTELSSTKEVTRALARSGLEWFGAVWISGDTSDEDETCAVHGIRSAGLVPDTGDPA